MKKKVIAAGHICLDITPAFPAGKSLKPSDNQNADGYEEDADDKISVSDVLLPGQLIEVNTANVSTGGSVANTGLALKILGANVTLMGKIGHDEFGNMLSSILDKYDAAEGMIRAEGADTSYSVVLAIPQIDRMFLHCPGANNTFTADDLPDDVLEEASLFHFGYPTIMRSMYINDGENLLSLMRKVKEHGCATSMDMSAIDQNSEAGKSDWLVILRRVIPHVDFFVPSFEELCFMIDRGRFESLQRAAGDTDMTDILDFDRDIRPIADACMNLGCKVLLLKCGKKGLYLRSASSEVIKEIPSELELDAQAWSNLDMFETCYKPDRVLSATGAGDTCIAAFLESLLEHRSPKMCIKLAAATGACCVCEYDALSGLKPLNELEKRINEGWEKV